MNENAIYEAVGNGTECGLLNFLYNNDLPVHEIIQAKHGNIAGVIPFSSIRKRELFAINHPDLRDTVRVYIKGAPEIILEMCTRTIGVDGQTKSMDDTEKEYILNDVTVGSFAKQGYRCLAFAHKDMSVDEFNQLKEDHNNFTSEADRESIERDFTFTVLFGLNDPLREHILESVLYANKGEINVRMISGDHIETAKAVAVKAGIISSTEADQPSVCMTAEEFRKQIGEIRKEIDDEGNEKVLFKDEKNVKSLAHKLKVLARATAQDKFHLVSALKTLNRVVAVTGDGLNDASALRVSDIGFAMGSGCSVAKDSSDMILIEDNFGATMNAVMWGRNIFQNIRKFIQFQLTVNISALLVCFLGSCIFDRSPLSIV